MKISKGSMIVMKDMRAGNLYLLKGTAVVCETTSVTSVNLDSSRLWHLQRGYIDEHGLDELRMRDLIDGIQHLKLGFYEECVLRKQTKISVGIEEHKAKASYSMFT